MKSVVGINMKVEGIHNFPMVEEVFGKEVNYLKYDHRHLFGIRAELEVTDLDREVEFIMMTHEVRRYLQEEYWSTAHQCCYFGAMSCEMIAKELMERFGFSMVQVDEDGENYARLTREGGENLIKGEEK